MKITVSFEQNEVFAVEKNAAEVAKILGKSGNTVRSRFDMFLAKVYKGYSRGFAGGRVMVDDKNNSVNFTIDVDARAFRMLCDALVKLFTMVWPMIAPFIGLPSAIRAFGKTIKETCNRAFEEYKTEYVESSMYHISRVKDTALDLDAVVVTESAVYGNDPRIVFFVHKSRTDHLNNSIIRTLMNNRPTPAIETMDTEDEAITRARELYEQFSREANSEERITL